MITLQYITNRSWEGFGCPATCDKFGVTANGRTTMCTFLGPEYDGKSIREYPLADLWQQHLARGDPFQANAQCARCPVLAVSSGGCRARARYYHQDINAPDPFCCALHERDVFIESHASILQSELDSVFHASA